MLSALLPIEEDDPSHAVLEVGLDFAKRHCNYVQGTCVRLDMPGALMYGGDMGTPLVLQDLEREDWNKIQRARPIFERAVQAAGLSETVAEFNPDMRPGAGGLAEHARLFDVTILAQPSPSSYAPRRSTLEAVLFEGGRGVLLIPSSARTAAFDTVVVAWNGSTETARTLAYARPLLEAARRTVVASVEGAMVSGPTAADVVRALARMGVAAEIRQCTQHRDGAGETFLDLCREYGADLLIKGAYTQSRLRQMIFGGATSHIIERAHLPVFLAH